MNRRRFLQGAGAVGVLGPWIALDAQPRFGVVGSQELQAPRLDCLQQAALLEGWIADLRDDRMTPIWFAERMNRYRTEWESRVTALEASMQSANVRFNQELAGTIGAGVGFVATIVATIALNKLAIPTYGVGAAALGVGVAVGATTFAIQAVLASPDPSSAMRFVAFHTADRTALILTSTRVRILQLTGILLNGLAFMMAFHQARRQFNVSEDYRQKLLSLRGQMEAFEDDNTAREWILAALVDNATFLRSLPGCRVDATPVDITAAELLRP